MELKLAKWCVAFAAVLSAFAFSVAAQDTPDAQPSVAANPGRPTVSNPATLVPVGYLQFETGFLGASDSPGLSSQYAFNQTVKLAVASRLQLGVSSQPVARTTAGDVSSSSVADTLVGAQFVLFPGAAAKPTIALSYAHRVYDGGAPDLDIGSPLNSVIAYVSADVRGFHYDANAVFNEVIGQARGVRRLQFGQTLSISHPLPRGFTLSGEIWHFTQPFLRGNAIGNLWALGYTVRPNLVLDAGFDKGITTTSTRWESFAGFTYLLPKRLWGRE